MDFSIPDLKDRKSMDRNYLVTVMPEGYEDDYRLIMLLDNNIPGLLKAVRRTNEGMEQIYYDISSLQPLGKIFDHKEIRKKDAVKLLQGIAYVFRSVHEYMLSEGGLILDPAYLFVDPDSLKPCLLYIPWCISSMQERLQTLMEYLMEHIDQNDPAAAMWTYRLYKTSKNENCVIGDIEKILSEQFSSDDTGYETTDICENKPAAAIPSDPELTIPSEDKKEKEEIKHERRQGLFTRVFGSRTKDQKEKGEKKASAKARQKDAEPLLNIPDFSEAFADMELTVDD